MNANLSYIEDYFNGQFADEERRTFEARCINDPVFAREVAFYITAREVLKEDAVDQRRSEFNALYKQLSGSAKIIPLYKKFVPYIAAACVLFLIIYSVFLKPPSAQQLASHFVKEELATLPVTMGNVHDSIALGVGAFNAHDYTKAEKIFYILSKKEFADIEAIEYLGKTYLVSGQYDKAIAAFDMLSSFPNLKANPGKFYKAVSLLMRSNDKDIEQAKKLLQDVVANHLPGSQEAVKWLKDL